jgi:putative membrane protein
MGLLSRFLVLVVAALHVGFLVLEMFLWTRPEGQRFLAQTPEFTSMTAVLAANQGLYNGFLAAGLVWGAVSNRRDLQVFFLVCVIMAGVFGGMTAKPSILVMQGGPAAVALAFVLMARRAS